MDSVEFSKLLLDLTPKVNTYLNEHKLNELEIWDSDQSDKASNIYNIGEPFDLNTKVNTPLNVTLRDEFSTGLKKATQNFRNVFAKIFYEGKIKKIKAERRIKSLRRINGEFELEVASYPKCYDFEYQKIKSLEHINYSLHT